MIAHLLTQHLKSATASPQIHSTDPEYFTFTTTTGTKQTCLFPLEDATHPLVHDLLPQEQQWYIITYDKKILQVVAPVLAEGKIDVRMMYEMKLREGKGQNSQLEEELEAAGIEIVDGQEWFIQTYPEKSNLVRKEQIWIARSRSNLEVMGHVEVLITTDVVYTGQLRVQPAHKLKGVARKLMQFVHAQGQNKAIWLSVFAENLPAIGLYHSLGYRIEKTLWDIMKVEGARVGTDEGRAKDVPVAS